MWSRVTTLSNHHLAKDTLPETEFDSIRPWMNSRFHICTKNGQKYLLKREDTKDDSDNIDHEYLVGLELNKLRPVNPHFVGTILLSHNLKPVMEKGSPTKYLLLEHVEGSVIKSSWQLHDLLRIFLQLSACLEQVQNVGFTHFNMHHLNGIMKNLGQDYILRYPGFELQTNSLLVLIDFGRSHTYATGGHQVKDKNVKNSYFPEHDLMYFIFSCILPGHRKEALEILEFYGYREIPSRARTKFLRSLDQIKIKLHSTSTLAKFLAKRFGFTTVYDKNCPVYKYQE